LEPDNLVSALGLAVDDTLRSSKRFIRGATMAKVNAQATDRIQATSPTETSQKNTGKHGRLDHSFRPQEHLSKTMSLGEATVWLGRFDNYLKWNELVTKDNACSRDLLEGCLEADLVAMLQEDVRVTRATTVGGLEGVLAKLRGYFVLHAWGLKETTCEPAEKAKTQDGHGDGDGTTPPPTARGEEVAIKTVMASLTHKENLQEARNVMPEVRMTRDRANQIQRTPPAGNQIMVVAFQSVQLAQASFLQKNQTLQNVFLISVMLR
jgi:hypothetical protein